MVGGNSEMWQIQHNVLHHTFTNIDGLDEDIDPGPILRFSPLKPHKPWHRFQHYYAWFFYGLMTLIWVTFKDFVALSKYNKFGLLKRMGKSRNELMFRIILAKVLYYPIVVGLPRLQRPRRRTGHRRLVADALRWRAHPRHGFPARPRDGGPRLHARGERRGHRG